MSKEQARENLDRLISFLDQDPENDSLLRDVANAAMLADDPDTADKAVRQLEAIADLSDADQNLAGLAAMRNGDQERASKYFETLLDEHPAENGLIFNLAWSRALAKDFDAAQELLDEDVIAALPQAAMLDLQLRHEKGDFESAEKVAREYLVMHNDYPPLCAAISVLALDVENEDLARECAERGGDHPDALTTLATLTLGEQRNDDARAMFEKALSMNQQSPRAWVGLGLANLAGGKREQAVSQLDKGAEMFGDHLGSWIAAGWAYFLKGDIPTARERFETALDLDDTFAESHGSLAVVDVLQEDRVSAERRIEIAQRLDRTSFSAAFARVLLVSSDGDETTAKRIMEIALKQPIDAKGRTIADALGGIAMGRA